MSEYASQRATANDVHPHDAKQHMQKELVIMYRK